MTSSHERSRSICSLLALLSFMQCRETALSVDYLGTYEYEEVKWLLRTEKRCSFIPYDTSEYFKESENAKTPCRIFVKPLWARDKEHEISRHHVQYHAYGAKYNYNFTTVNCSTTSDRKLDMLILCEGETVTNRTTCRTDSECGETETCRKHLDMDQQICIPTRHLYESCDDSSSCKNSECRGTDRNRSCQCPSGMRHTALNGQIECLKSNLSLGQSCVHDMQCKGTRNAERCLNGECFCEEGFVLQGLRCLPDRRRIDEACEGHLQCSGNLSLGQTCTFDIQCMATDNVGRCHNGKCSCAEDYVLHKLRCLPGGKRLGESCDEHIQCIGTVNAGVCCKNKTCTCNEGSINIQGECLQGNLSLGQTCIYDKQCMDTENGRKCLNGECFCAKGYVLQRLRCLPGNLSLDQACQHNVQCTATENSGRCIDGKCFCAEGHKLQKLRCIPGNLSLDQSCSHDAQCTSTENGGRCLNGKCSCNEGFALENLSCVPGKRASFISWITEEHGVYLMTGSGVICVIVICSAILVVLNRRKSGKMRAPTTTQHSIAERSGFQNIPNEIRLESLYSDPIDSHWRKEEE
uniref:Tenascin-like isoform X2 n=1 Tax=Crassostrea virginica TaxID=6565 RepID=A0A8B8B3E8_CRAVI|nr:tenascin-like isoform X2 [Crassostrea virginica]